MVQLEQRIEDLEMKLAFQDDTIESLNQQVIRLNDLLADQQEKLRLLTSKLSQVEPSNIASQAEETPPPHY
ncbi:MULTISPECIES: SlyX family protein [Shewanella]|uniref:Protein SlyX homolog n=1 Tax=Shewanella loihica (strain ATCC BAA-1088 / PV-4) TaxID=323850 RepID=SLYX_SHELP|nr:MULTISPECIES: SlyX family protein [Shewanella]A3QB62.1 RecName: Full=Protein SlyX homolog [Shewanella loihica PV-4]ABO22710.1 SlyX family protein [Shewanella loihica PV-4]QYJ83244.1 SlyX family protein [Shewanella aegiceratis]QYJ89240.1 SlyX family protein [Shewanella halotolerans]QYJ94610.1 SlyX family protein [Shewanella spartinae]QYJ98463.1 SlyX family protein [Shewanella alkalitolerans]